MSRRNRIEAEGLRQRMRCGGCGVEGRVRETMICTAVHSCPAYGKHQQRRRKPLPETANPEAVLWQENGPEAKAFATAAFQQGKFEVR